MAAHDHLQPQLFDPGPEVSQRMPLGRFFDRASWHGSDNPRLPVEKKVGPLHSGTLRAAQERRDYTRFPGEGDHYYPVVPNRVYSPVLDDLEANEIAGTGNERLYDGGADPRARTAFEEGTTLPYYNHVEDEGSTSFVSPEGGYATVHDTDLGLAEGTGWKPRPSLTAREIGWSGAEPVGERERQLQFEMRRS